MFSRSRLAAIILLLTFTALPAVAQEIGPGILPADTSFFMFSQGTAHAENYLYGGEPDGSILEFSGVRRFSPARDRVPNSPFRLESERPADEIYAGADGSDIFNIEESDDVWLFRSD